MGLALENLDGRTRDFMLTEVESDIKNGRLFMSARFTPQGASRYPDLLREAIRNGDDDSLAASLRASGCFAEWEEGRRGPKTFRKRVPVNAAQTLAESEFNRFYLRGLCMRATANDVPSVEVYRAKEVAEPRPESIAMIGTRVDPTSLLADLRANIGVDTALGLPAGPNSGLSARFPIG
jgi:hypothetical protein